MLFTLTLGVLLGIAGVTLIRQWLGGALEAAAEPADVLTPSAFPHLAPSRASRLPLRPQPYRTWRPAA